MIERYHVVVIFQTDLMNQEELEKKLSEQKKAILAILKINGNLLETVLQDCPQYADSEQAIINSTSKFSGAIDLASDRLRQDKDLAKRLCLINQNAYIHLLPAIREDKDLILFLIENGLSIYSSLSHTNKGDEEIANTAIKWGSITSDVFETPLVKNRNIVKKVIENSYHYLKQLPKDSSFLNDREIISYAIKQNTSAFTDVGNIIRYDTEFLKAMIKRDPSFYHCIDLEDKKQDSLSLTVAYFEEEPVYPNSFIRLVLDQTDNNLLINVEKVLKGKSQSYFLDALKFEDNEQIKEQGKSKPPFNDFCSRQIISNLNLENLNSYAVSDFLTNALMLEKQRRKILSLTQENPSTKNKLQRRKNGF